MDRTEALREVLRRYIDHMHENIPVHEWPDPAPTARSVG
jgi:hypothetical protein